MAHLNTDSFAQPYSMHRDVYEDKRLPGKDENYTVQRAPQTEKTLFSGISSRGQTLPVEDVALGRSPGMWSVQPNSDRSKIVVGEPWIGVGETEATGGLEGTSEDSPGWLYLPNGRLFSYGGSEELSVDTLVSQAGDDGRLLLVALVPPPKDTGGVVFRAVDMGDASTGLEQWHDIQSYIPSYYSGWYILPIACFYAESIDSTYRVTDIYWRNESPVIPLGVDEVTWDHPWKLVASLDGSTLHYSVHGGRVHDGDSWRQVTGISETTTLNDLYVWLRVKHYNYNHNYSHSWGYPSNLRSPSEYEVVTGTSYPASSYNAPVLAAAGDHSTGGWCQIIVPLAQYTAAGGLWQYQISDILMAYGETYFRDVVVDIYWYGTQLRYCKTRELVVRGILQNCDVVSGDILFDTGPCPTT